MVSQVGSQLQTVDGREAIQQVLGAFFDSRYLRWLTVRCLERLVNDESRIRLPLEYRDILCEKAESCELADLVIALQDGCQKGEIEAWLEIVRDLCLDAEAIDNQLEDLSVTGLKVRILNLVSRF